MAQSPNAQSQKPKTLIDKLSNVLVYIISFPFIIFFIALRRALAEKKGQSHSYRDRLPEMHPIGGSGSGKG